MGPVPKKWHGQIGTRRYPDLEDFWDSLKYYPNGTRVIKPTPYRSLGCGVEVRSRDKIRDSGYYTWWMGHDIRMILDTFQARQIFCYFYTQICVQSQDFAKLVQLVDNGYNLRLVGRGGYDIEDIAGGYYDLSNPYRLSHLLDKCYRDTSRPFGYEL